MRTNGSLPIGIVTLSIVLGGLAGLGILAAPPAHARRHSGGGSSRHGEAAVEQAERLRTTGAAALGERKLDEARQALEDSYTRLPAPETLYYLGQLALAESKVLEAQDLMRRFVREAGAAADPQQQKEAARIALLPSQPFGELEILSARNTLVRVDGRLLGVLPLAQPLLVTSGTHTVVLQLGSQRLESPVEIRTGRAAQLRFDLQTGVAVVTLPPTVLLVQDYGAFPPTVQDVLANAAEQAVRAESHAILHPRPALVRAPELASCVRTQPCQVQLMQRNEVEYAIALTLLLPVSAPAPAPAAGTPTGVGAAPAGGVILHGELLDAAMGQEVALSLNQPIDLSVPAQAAATTTELVARLLKEGRARPRGTLEISSNPPGASVVLPYGTTGLTPYSHPAWAGSYDVMVQKPGYAPARLRVNILPEQKESQQLTLTPLAGPPPKRPLWRTVTGAVAIGLGGTILLTTTSSLFSSDSSTVAVGASGVTVGSLLVVGGVLLLTLPVKKPAPKPSTTQVP